MDGELVSGSLSVTERGEPKEVRPSFHTYTEQFYEHFPYYLSIGMTYEQYWESDPMLAKYYRKADEMKNDRKNQELWLQGMYIYEALCDVSPIMTAIPKKGAKPLPYPEKPYTVSEKQRKRAVVDKDKKIAEKGKMFMEMFMSQSNKQLKDKGS